MRWTRVVRVFLGFLLAPIPVTLFFGMVALSFLGSFGQHENPEAFLLQVPLWSYGITLLFGLPIHLILQRLERPGLLYYVLAGLNVAALFALFPAGFEYGPIAFLSSFIIVGFFILITVIPFWLIAVWQPRWPRWPANVGSAVRARFSRNARSLG